MESAFLKKNLIARFEELLGCSIPGEIPANDRLDKDSVRLYYEGYSVNQETMQKYYKFKLRCYADNWGAAMDKIDIAGKYLQTAQPEIFVDDDKRFTVRYYNITLSRADKVNSAGSIYLYSEIEFVIIC